MNSKKILRLHYCLHKLLPNTKNSICTSSVFCYHGNQYNKEEILSTQRADRLTVKCLKHTLAKQRMSVSNLFGPGSKTPVFCGLNEIIFYEQRRQKGHSHYQNIKATKEANDKVKSDLKQRISRQIVANIKEGGPDPKSNISLARVLDEAKAKNVPNEVVQRAMKRATSSIESGKEELIECTGTGGLMLIVSVYTENIKRTRNDVQSKLKKYGASTSNSGTAMHSFERKGIVEVELKEGDSRDHDHHIELALEAEADDVTMETRDDGNDVLQFESDHLRVNRVKKYLESKGMNVIYAEPVFQAVNTITMSEENISTLSKLVDTLKDIEEVEDVYTNAVSED